MNPDVVDDLLEWYITRIGKRVLGKKVRREVALIHRDLVRRSIREITGLRVQNCDMMEKIKDLESQVKALHALVKISCAVIEQS